jgi:hypothetical protein
MERLIKNIIYLTLMVLAASFIINIFTPFYWGDYTQTTKILHYKSNPERYNSIFFGGSLEYRHINPAVVDAVVKDGGIPFSSFNVAIDGHNIIQQLRDIEGMLDIKNPKLKYIFVSLSSEPYFYPPNKNTPKWISWQNAFSCFNALMILSTLNDHWRLNGAFMFFYTTAFIKKNFNLGLLPSLMQSYMDRPHFDQAYLGKNKDGYFPYEDEEQLLIENYKWADELISKSNEIYLKEKGKRDSLTNDIRVAFRQYSPDAQPNKQELNMLLNLMTKCAKKGVDVYFLLPPRSRTSYTFLLPIFHRLPQERCIELANPDTYPEFYKVENGYNFYHMNKKGANIYSEKLGERIVEILKQ